MTPGATGLVVSCQQQEQPLSLVDVRFRKAKHRGPLDLHGLPTVTHGVTEKSRYLCTFLHGHVHVQYIIIVPLYVVAGKLATASLCSSPNRIPSGRLTGTLAAINAIHPLFYDAVLMSLLLLLQ